MKNKYQLKNIRQQITACLFMLPLTYSLIAQTPTSVEVTGQITDGASPIPGATVLIKGEQRGTVSDLNGLYKINAHASDTLMISYIGYATVMEPVLNRSVINITMHVDATTLREVIINAGYYTVRDKERTGSISRITTKEIENQPVNNPLEAMQGRMAGVSISQNSGIPGAGFDVRIRGQNSILAGNDPLYVIDGVPFDSKSLTSYDTSVGIIPRTNYSPLNFLNTSDIESVEVLKDADATAIYGSRGANGVILITTKKTAAGKTRFSIKNNTGFAKVTGFMDLMNTQQYLQMRRQAFQNDGLINYPAQAYDVNGTWDQNRYKDWQKELIGGTARFNNLQGTVSGGNSNTKFHLGGAFHQETTVYPGDFKFKRGTFFSKLNHSAFDNKLLINFSTNYSTENNFLPGTDLTVIAKSIAPNAPELYTQDGDINWEDGTWVNPLSYLEGVYKAKRNSLLSNLVISYDITTNLTLKSNLGFTDTRIAETNIRPHTMLNPAYGLNSSTSQLYTNDGYRQSWIVEPQLDWNQQMDKSSLGVTLGSTFQKQISESIGFLGLGFQNNNFIYNLSAASNIIPLSEKTNQYNYQAAYGRINYNWDKKYIINVTGRRDGSSRFGDGNRFANFGAVGLAWVISNESFIEQALPSLSFAKLRASYGITGNDQIGDYQYFNTFRIISGNYDGIIGLEPSRLHNSNFGWEKNKKLEIALETGFLNDRVYITAGYFRNRSSNQLIGMPLPGTTGFATIQSNLDATVQNTGWEFELQTTNIKSDVFSWSTSFNLTIPKNELLDFPGLENSTYANSFVIGQSLSILKLYNLIGVNPDTGLFEFEDYNNDGQITSPDDRQYIVDLAPKYYGGLANTVTYKNISLDFHFQFVKKMAQNHFYYGSTAGIMVNQPVDVLDSWQSPGDTNTFQAYTTGANSQAVLAYSNFMRSNAAVSDGSYIRLKNIALSYNLPIEKSTGIKTNIFIQGQNLLTFTKFKGDDPEQVPGYLPPLKRITAGVQIQF